MRIWTVLGCAVMLQACGGLTVTPTSPSGSTPSRPREPLTITFRGTLADGGSFEGSLTYGGNDRDDRENYGRYNGGTWNVVVTGGRATRDAQFSDTTQGRAAIETTSTPTGAIGLIFLWPNADPKVQELSPHFRSVSGYDPDVQPSLGDLGELLPGSLDDDFGVYRDGQGGQTLVSSIQVTRP